MVKDLNDQYELFINDNNDIWTALEKMIEKYPYRVLSSFTFDSNETPLRSARVVEGPPSETVVSSNEPENPNQNDGDIDDDDDFSICHFPHHREFVKAVRLAEKGAKESGVRVPYYWRGYRGYVAPTLPRIDVSELQLRLMNALQRIPNLSVPEILVTLTKLYIIYCKLFFIFIFLL